PVVLRGHAEGRRARAGGKPHPCRATHRRRAGRSAAHRAQRVDNVRAATRGRALRAGRAADGARAVKLYDAARCPYCARVRIALAEKGLDYEAVEIDLRNRPEWL